MMLELEQIVDAWRGDAENTPVDKHPTVWVTHYDEYRFLGGVAINTPNSIGNAILFLGLPWTVSADVVESVVIVDVNHVLHVTQLTDDGEATRSTDWHVPYHIDDFGHFRFDVAEKKPSAFWADLHILFDSRSTGKGDLEFAGAFRKALSLGNQLL